MRIFETAKFHKQRKRLKSKQEKEALKKAVIEVIHDPDAGKKLKGELKDLLSKRYSVKGQDRRLVYKVDKDMLTFMSFGPRGSIY